MEECIFCKIVKNEIPCYKVYEDEMVLAFLDIHPAAEGHTLIVPKEHYVNIFDIKEDVLKRIIIVSKNISKKLLDLEGIEGVNLFQSNNHAAEQEIMHFHFHVIPRKKDDGIKINRELRAKELTVDEFNTILRKIRI